MKKMLCVVLTFILMLCVIPVHGNATEVEMIHFEDGCYMTIETVTFGARASGTVTGTKKSTYYGSDGGSEWVATLTGKFTYTGSSAACNSSSIDVTIYDSDWYVVSKSASKSGNTATGSATMGLKNAGVTTKKVPVSLSLQCDANGNLS